MPSKPQCSSEERNTQTFLSRCEAHSLHLRSHERKQDGLYVRHAGRIQPAIYPLACKHNSQRTIPRCIDRMVATYPDFRSSHNRNAGLNARECMGCIKGCTTVSCPLLARALAAALLARVILRIQHVLRKTAPIFITVVLTLCISASCAHNRFSESAI